MVAFLIYVLVDFLKKLAVICFKIGICIDVNTKNGAVKVYIFMADPFKKSK